MNLVSKLRSSAIYHFFVFLALIFSFVSGVTVSGVSHAHEGATGIVKERMDNFKKSQNNLKAIRRLIRDGDAEPVVPLADEIRAWAARIPEYFPEGSGGAPSEAADTIWQDFKGFRDAARRHEDAAEALVKLARNGDVSRLNQAFGEVAGTCKACHQRFRQ